MENSSLLCEENVASLGDEESFDAKEDDDEYIKLLFDKEINGNGLLVQNQEEESVFVNTGNWIKEARLEAIQYILNNQETFGFEIQTAYLAITYLSIFLSRRLVEGGKSWALRLLAVACLSLAAKMEEQKVPNLSDFPRRDYFDSKLIKKMELLVLDTLDWKMAIITPFAFTNYFISKFCPNSLMDIQSRVIEVILSAVRVVLIFDCLNLITEEKTMHYRPSVIAAAATLLMMNKTLNREALQLKINTTLSSSSGGCNLKIEDVFLLHNQMKEMDIMEKYKLTNSDYTAAADANAAIIMENSSVSSASAKRKSLTFNDQNSEFPDNKKRPC
ncbi:hypothetical protein M9H77_32383 [Catharanthus roseus]|uniref:Uncharacterized protein n=1 Tax=Catharanthus roseus TaxID=4058 RepID=A0ACC0A358_CATRO|nr:hypothetical protein M9H77_32383 [Catharanthus roseus]